MDEKILKSIYVISKHAKKYSEKASKSYRKSDPNKARVNSIKKDALYQLKAQILDDFKKEANIEIHVINNKKYFYFSFDSYSFHSPLEQHSIKKKNKTRKTLKRFNKSKQNKTNQSLKKALLNIQEKLNYNANNFLKQKYIKTQRNNQLYTGWSYLLSSQESNTTSKF